MWGGSQTDGIPTGKKLGPQQKSYTPWKCTINTQNDATFERRYIFQIIMFGIYINFRKGILAHKGDVSWVLTQPQLWF